MTYKPHKTNKNYVASTANMAKQNIENAKKKIADIERMLAAGVISKEFADKQIKACKETIAHPHMSFDEALRKIQQERQAYIWGITDRPAEMGI